MPYFHHTIRRYTSVLLDKLNEICVPFESSDGTIQTKNVPFVYGAREKFDVLETNSDEQLLRGNLNVLPRGYIKMDVMNRDESRMLNKNIKINKFKHDFSQEYSYNAIPYNFMYSVEIMCRGMNEATCVMEQLAVLFNPLIAFDIYDADNLDECTRVPIKLMDCNVAIEDYEETSMNIATVTASIELDGYLYPPIKSFEKIKELIISTQGTRIDKEILGWDVDQGQIVDDVVRSDKLKASAKLRILNVLNTSPNSENTILNPEVLYIGENTLKIDYNAVEHTNVQFKVQSMSDNASVLSVDTNKIVLNVLNLDEPIVLDITGTDAFNNVVTFTKMFE